MLKAMLRPIQTESGWAERAGAIIRTMSLYSRGSGSGVRLLSECPLYKFIVLIMAPSRTHRRRRTNSARISHPPPFRRVTKNGIFGFEILSTIE